LGATIASTGPYMVASVTETELLLVRNPHFSEWSRGAQPDGYPDEIRWTGGLDPDQQVDAILAGDADLMLTWPPTERIGELPTRMPGQYHPFFAGTAFAFFANPSEPPFDDERLRRAVNLAVDRRVITEILGGPLFARETCQAIPPNFHGYEPYCPYTLDPNPANRWTAPDRSAALALVREAGIPDTPIEVWTYHPVQHPFGAHIATVLRDLGFDATHQEVERDPFFNDLDAARTMDIGVIAWFAEYPAASNFVSALFSCAAFANFSDFCDPDLDARMADATDLQARDPAAAARLWAEVDRAITDFGLWIPLVNVGDSLHLVSTRVGNYQWHPAYGLLLSQLWVQ
jgi:peptide/nickel transport system substrate-binding protein